MLCRATGGVNPNCSPAVPRGQALAESLKSNRSLKSLRLHNNNIGDRGAEALAAGLLQNRSLRHFTLSKFGSNLWHCCGSRGTPGYKALEEAEKIKKERGENFWIDWI